MPTKILISIAFIVLTSCSANDSSNVTAIAHPAMAELPAEPLTPEAAKAVVTDHSIILVGAENMDPALVQRTADAFAARYRVTVKRAFNLTQTSDCLQPNRQQLTAECLLDKLESIRTAAGISDAVVMMGVVPDDMWIQSIPDWRYGFSFRRLERNVAIVSSARMGQMQGVSSVGETRLRKMLLKNISILAFGLGRSSDPESVRFGDIMGPADLDARGEKF